MAGDNRPDDHFINIPLGRVPTAASYGSSRGLKTAEGETNCRPSAHHQDTGFDSLGQKKSGRRRLRSSGEVSEAPRLTTMGKLYMELLHSSIITRYIIYIFPLSIILAIPTLIGAFGPGKKVTVGGVRMVWFFLWVCKVELP